MSNMGNRRLTRQPMLGRPAPKKVLRARQMQRNIIPRQSDVSIIMYTTHFSNNKILLIFQRNQ